MREAAVRFNQLSGRTRRAFFGLVLEGSTPEAYAARVPCALTVVQDDVSAALGALMELPEPPDGSMVEQATDEDRP